MLREAEGRRLYFAGTAAVWLYPSDTPNYRSNLAAASPRIWVVLRPAEGAAHAEGDGPGMVLQGVTVDAGEAETFGDTVADLVEALPMPPGLLARTASFVARHHVDRPFHKRRRDRADPEALGRRRREETP